MTIHDLATDTNLASKADFHPTRRDSSERDAFVTVVDALSAAVFVIDGTARIVHSNAAAEHLIARGDFAVREGRLAPSGPTGHSALRAALAKGDGRPALVAVQTASGPLIAALLPMRADGTFAVIVKRQPAESPPIGKVLMQAFNLTRREVNVLIPLLRGQSLEAAAAELGIAVPTARSHLHKLLAKTETTRQGELIQKVLDLLPPVAIET